MVNLHSFFNPNRQLDFSSLLDFAPLSTGQKQHLTKVYTTLASCAVLTMLSTFIPMKWLKIRPIFGLLAFSGSLIYVRLTSDRIGSSQPVASYKRISAMAILSVTVGLTLREVLALMIEVNPAIVPNALFGTLAIFSCFSLASLFMTSRVALYFGGSVMSLSVFTIGTNIANIFLGSKLLNNFKNASMLVLYSAAIVLNTQLTIQDYNKGSRDFLAHALQLYLDTLDVFLEIGKVLCEREKEKQEKEKKRKQKSKEKF